MFRTLHRIAVVGFICLAAGIASAIGLFAYHQRAVFYPIADGYEAFNSWVQTEARDVSEISGQVVKVEDDYTFRMKDGSGLLYHFRLAGLEAQSLVHAASKTNLAWRRTVRTNLSDMILSNKVQVLAIYLDDRRSGSGLAFVGETNVNAVLVERGLAKVKTEYLKGLPLKAHYAFLRAQRRARERQVGLWSSEPFAEQTARVPGDAAF